MFGTYSKAEGDTKWKYLLFISGTSGAVEVFLDDGGVVGVYAMSEGIFQLNTLSPKHPLRKYCSSLKHTDVNLGTLLQKVNELVPTVSTYYINERILLAWKFIPEKKVDPNNFFLPEKDLNRVLSDELGDTFIPPADRRRKIIKTIRDLLIAWNPHFRMSGLDAPIELPEPYVEPEVEKAYGGPMPVGLMTMDEGFPTSPPSTSCHAVTQKGMPCKIKAKSDHVYCWKHGPTWDQVIKSKGPAECHCDGCTTHNNGLPIGDVHNGECRECHALNVAISPWGHGHGGICVYCISNHPNMVSSGTLAKIAKVIGKGPHNGHP